MIRALPAKKASLPLLSGEASDEAPNRQQNEQASAAPQSKPKPTPRPVPIAPRRYKLQVTIGQEMTDKPRQPSKKTKNKNRGIPAHARREVFERDEGRCAFVDARGRRCGSKWQVEFHHRVPYARGGTHGPDNIELRCRAHNQYGAELEYGVGFMETRRTFTKGSIQCT
jgi:5-methylcytosine-specific restriction endonuclease McrA